MEMSIGERSFLEDIGGGGIERGDVASCNGNITGGDISWGRHQWGKTSWGERPEGEMSWKRQKNSMVMSWGRHQWGEMS